jgi:hypothetical protein
MDIEKNFRNTCSQAKKNINSFTEKITDGVKNMKGSINDFSVLDKLKEYSTSAVQMVGELDENLCSSNSPYEVGYFRVSGNISITGGMTLDIYFTKTQTAKSISQESSKLLTIINPNTQRGFKISRLSLAGKKQAKVRDPLTKEIFIINSKTGEVLCKHN